MPPSAVRDAQHSRYDGEEPAQPQREANEDEDSPAGSPQIACGAKGCYLPWDEHLTKKGAVRIRYQNTEHQPASAAQVSRRAGRRAAIRSGNGRGFLRPSSAARRKAPASFVTHVSVKGSNGKTLSMPIEQFAKLMEEYRQENGVS